jgi:hypothetical protein
MWAIYKTFDDIKHITFCSVLLFGGMIVIPYMWWVFMTFWYFLLGLDIYMQINNNEKK